MLKNVTDEKGVVVGTLLFSVFFNFGWSQRRETFCDATYFWNWMNLSC